MKLANVFLISYLLSVMAFGFIRTKYDLRWSAWAVGDAQAVNAARHFAREGFAYNYFLEYYHPGFLGKSIGNESPVGYYTRYPPFCSVWNGLLIRYFDASLRTLQCVSIVFYVLALLFAYLSFGLFFSKRAAFFSTVFISISPGYLQMMGCLAAYPYSEFFRFSIIYVFLRWAKSREA